MNTGQAVAQRCWESHPVFGAQKNGSKSTSGIHLRGSHPWPEEDVDSAPGDPGRAMGSGGRRGRQRAVACESVAQKGRGGMGRWRLVITPVCVTRIFLVGGDRGTARKRFKWNGSKRQRGGRWNASPPTRCKQGGGPLRGENFVSLSIQNTFSPREVVTGQLRSVRNP